MKKMIKAFKVACAIKNKEKDNPEIKLNSAFIYFLKMVQDSLLYGLSSDEFRILQVYKMTKHQKGNIITRRDRNLIVKKYNDLSKINLIENKSEFLVKFQQFIGRDFILMQDCSLAQFDEFVNKHRNFIAKHSDGRQGQGIKTFHLSPNSSIELLYEEVVNSNFDVVEELLVQHSTFCEINERGLPSIRVLTFLNDDLNVDILSTTLNVGIADEVINAHRDAIKMDINIEKGHVTSVGVDKSGNTYECHPSTRQPFQGFKVPFWQDVKNMVEDAANVYPCFRYVGWDVGITDDGPVIIEANAVRPGITANQSPQFSNGEQIFKRFSPLKKGL